MSPHRVLMVAALLAVAFGFWPPTQTAFAAPVGVATVVTPASETPLAAGGSATPFSLALPDNAACTGDSADDGYRVQSYMVPAAVDPTTLRFGAAGPEPRATGAAFRQPLYTTTSSPFVDEQTANTDVPGDSAVIVNVPAFHLAVFAAGEVPAGDYNVGIACTKGSAANTHIDRVWNVAMSLRTSASDAPAGVTWVVASVAANVVVTVPAAANPIAAAAAGNDTDAAGAVTASAAASAAGANAATSISATQSVPSGKPPSFGLPAFDLLSWSRLTSGGPFALLAWIVAAALVACVATLLVRTPNLNPAASR